MRICQLAYALCCNRKQPTRTGSFRIVQQIRVNMTSIFCIGTSRFAHNSLSNRLYKICKTCVVTQTASIKSKAKRTNLPPRPPPFPYKKKSYNLYQRLVDPMLYRFDENTKVISVEGAVATGKTEFAKKLADELGMHFITPPTFDTIYIDPYNFDARTLDPFLRPDSQTCDVKRYLTDPYHINVSAFQYQYYTLKFERYLKAILHLLSTGQGIVFERSPHTDVVFMKAMHNAGYVRKDVVDAYLYSAEVTLREVPVPHLFIYLDTPVNEVKKKIQQRNIDFEVNSKVLTTEYLTDLETLYKQECLKKLSNESHLLIYDWTEPGDILPVIEDIEDLDFEDYRNKRFKSWVFSTVDAVKELRYKVDDRYALIHRCMTSAFKCPELYEPAEDVQLREEVFSRVPSRVYQPGYNKGDKGWLWKSIFHTHDPFEPREVPPHLASKLG